MTSAVILAISQLLVAAVTISLTTMVLSTAPSTGHQVATKQADPESANQRISILSLSSLCRTVDKSGHQSADADPFECSHQCVISTVRSACLLWCRIVAVGVFMTEFHVWTLIVFGVHWCIALLWLVLQDSASESGPKTPSPAVSLFRRALVAYLLVFDWPPRHQSQTTKNQPSPQATYVKCAGSWLDVVGLGGPPRSVAMAVYYGFSGLENAAMMSLWFHFGPASDLMPPVARLTTLASCTAAFTLGILCVVASTQGSEEAASSASSGHRNPSVYGHDLNQPPTYSKVNPHSSVLLDPTLCSVSHQRETLRTVVQVHRTKTSARLTQSALNVASHQMNDMAATQLWERVSLADDESSNSRNTNTLEGALMGSGSGSGLGLTSCPSPPPSNAVNNATFSLAPSTVAPVSTWNRNVSPYRDPSTFTGSRSSFSAHGLLNKTNDSGHPLSTVMVKRPYVCCPRSSTPKRMVRRNSSCSSMPSVSIKAAPRIGRVSATTTRRGKHPRQCRRKGTCHCRIFDFDAESPALGILIRDNQNKSGQKSATSSLGRLSQGFDADPHRQFKILCATCLGAHDPLLTSCSRCHDDTQAAEKVKSLTTGRPAVRMRAVGKSQTLPVLRRSAHQHPVADDSVSVCSSDYPSEVTCTRHSHSSSSSSCSSQSDATYTTWPPTVRVPTMERLLSEHDPSPWNYVNAWLANSKHSRQVAGISKSGGGRVSKRRLRAVALVSQVKGPAPKGHHHIHQHQQRHLATNPGVEDIYTAYCTVPPRLGKSIKELSLIRTLAHVTSPAEHQYSSPMEIVV